MSSLHTMHAEILRDYLATSGIRKTRLARDLECSHSLIYQWLQGDIPISARMAIRLEQVTHGAIRRRDLFPELFERSPSRKKGTNRPAEGRTLHAPKSPS